MFHTDPVRPVPAAQRAQFQPWSAPADRPALPPDLAQSAQILARLALDQPRGRLTASQIVIMARNAQGHYPAQVQAAAVLFHAQRHTVRAAFEAQRGGSSSGSGLFGAGIRGYRHADLQGLAATFAGQAAPPSAASPQSAVPPQPGWHTPPDASASASRPAGPQQNDRVDEALCRLGRFMQRSHRAFLSVERLLSMERGGSSPARQALDSLSRWGRAVGGVVEDRARLLLTEMESRYGDLEVLERRSEQAARQAQHGVFGYPGGDGVQSPSMFRRSAGPVITEVDESEDGGGHSRAFPPDPVRPTTVPRSSGPVITELVEPAPYRPARREPEMPPRPRPRFADTE